MDARNLGLATMDRRPTALKLAYDGSGFKGWQRQPGLPTVQAAVERALGEVLGTKVEIFGAARTDAGVHAEGQVCHLVKQAVGPGEVAALGEALKILLPPAITLLAAAPAGASFHARSSSSGKRYRYRFAWGAVPPGRDLFHLGSGAQPRWELARAALEGLAGLEALPGLSSPSKDRRPAPPLGSWELHESRAKNLGDGDGDGDGDGNGNGDGDGNGIGGVCTLSVAGPAFRKHQIRNIAGHLAAVALGFAAPDTLALLAKRTRPWMGATAPPQGLTLVHVDYPAGVDPFA